LQCKNGGQLTITGGCQCATGFGGLDCSVDLSGAKDFSQTDGSGADSFRAAGVYVFAAAMAAVLAF
jgi:hypothetical protein